MDDRYDPLFVEQTAALRRATRKRAIGAILATVGVHAVVFGGAALASRYAPPEPRPSLVDVIPWKAGPLPGGAPGELGWTTSGGKRVAEVWLPGDRR